MSKTGRLQDAFYDILDGYDNGDGSRTDGPLARHPQLGQTIDRLVDAALSILGGDEA